MSLNRFYPILGCLVIIAYFVRLFVPTPSVLFTAEFLRSDNWHYNYPAKNFLSESLKSGQVPLWNKHMGTGFPVLAESQVGTFYLPNLVLFGLLPTATAWNLGLILSFILNFLGMYLVLRDYHTPFTAWWGALIYTFSGVFILHLVHYNSLQTTCLLPWVFWASRRLLTSPTFTHSSLLALIVSQQFLAGYLQYFFITLVGFSIYIWIGKPRGLQIKYLFITGLLTLGLSAVQLLPSLEFTSWSTRGQGIETESVFRYPLTLSDLFALISPRLTPNLVENTYPLPHTGVRGIYWENIAYLGSIPFFLALWVVFKKRTSQSWNKFLIAGLVISLLLALGEVSPLFWLHSLPPFSLFRLPSRFLLLSSFTLIGLACVGLDYLSHSVKKIAAGSLLITIIVSMSMLDVFEFSHHQFSTVPQTQVLTPPPLLQTMAPNSRIYVHPSANLSWQTVFEDTGWKQGKDYLPLLQNLLLPNQNLDYHLTSSDYYAGGLLNRTNLYALLQTHSALNTQAVNYVISTQALPYPELQLSSTTSLPTTPQIQQYIYQNPQALQRFRFAPQVVAVSSYTAAIKLLKNTPVNLNTTAVIETEMMASPISLNIADLSLETDTHQYQQLKTNTNQEAWLIIADTYEANWKATIDNKPIQIFPANLNQRAVLVPKGMHTLRLQYTPTSFYRGAFISIVTLGLMALYQSRGLLQGFFLTLKGHKV